MTPEQIDRLLAALEELSFGTRNGTPGPGALEAISIALNGPGDIYMEGRSVAHGLIAIAHAINDLADAVRET